MNGMLLSLSRFLGVLALLLVLDASASAQSNKTYQPVPDQPGKDVVWVPTPPELVEKMLDLAHVTSADYVVDLGSGDGRNVIAAARRGARALGVEYNPDLVALSQRAAEAAGVGRNATFVQGDMFKADFSQATVLALFLMPEHLFALRDKFFALKPGTRIVSNTFPIEDWDPDETARLPGECKVWCTALLYVVPAKVQGVWHLGPGELSLTQEYQTLAGTLTSGSNNAKISAARMRGNEIHFTVDGRQYVGRVNGNTMEGTVTAQGQKLGWKATR